MTGKLLLTLAGWLLGISLALAQININTATPEQLDGLKGIGPTKAQAIVDYRQKHGPFKSVDELQNVPGIGPATLKDLRGSVAVTGASRLPAAPEPATRPAPRTAGQSAALPAPAAPRPAAPAAPAKPAALRPASPTQPAVPPPAADVKPAAPTAPARPALPSPAAPATPGVAPKPAAPAAPAATTPAPAAPARPAAPAQPARPAAY